MHILYSCLSLYFYLSVYPLSPLMGSCRSIWPVICSRNCFVLWPLMGGKKTETKQKKNMSCFLPVKLPSSVIFRPTIWQCTSHTATTAPESRRPQVISCWGNNRRLKQSNLFKKVMWTTSRLIHILLKAGWSLMFEGEARENLKKKTPCWGGFFF